jgi:hypothetical protein
LCQASAQIDQAIELEKLENVIRLAQFGVANIRKGYFGILKVEHGME